MATPSGHFNRFPQITAQMREKSDAVVRAAAFNIQERIVASFSGPKSGRTYMVNGREHVASAPGEPPGIVFGTFAGSVQVQHPQPGLAIISSNDEKGPYLEFGTHDMAARPSFGPAAEAEKDGYFAAMRAIFGGLR